MATAPWSTRTMNTGTFVDQAARRLGVTPARCVVLEDSATGLLAARAAGMHPVLIQRRDSLRATLRPLALLALASLDDFAALLDAVTR